MSPRRGGPLKNLSIRVRLTLWYFAFLALALCLFGAGVWLAMRQSLFAAVDASLRDRVEGVRRFIEQESPSLSLEEIRYEFREHSVLGPGWDLFQVADSDSRWIYRSDPLYDSKVPIYRAHQLQPGPRFEDIAIGATPLRFLSSNVVAHGKTYTVQVAAPMHEIREGLAAFGWILIGGVPLVLFLASAGGYWMSRRALAPVDRITNTARSITAQNLSKRLDVPPTGDELQRLSTTLNTVLERLDAAFSRVTRFTADASHELRTPVSLMRTTAELALRRERRPEEYRDALAQILTELERTSTLIEDLLVLARADSGGESMTLTPVDLAASVAEACEQGHLMATAKQLQFGVRLPPEPVHVMGDASALRRLFLILMDNAVKYTPEAGMVSVKVERSGGTGFVEVRDTGIGVAEEDLPHIFDRFYRADKARSREAGGAGLGLSIAQWIVHAHGGLIEARSQLEQGSVFMVRLPIAGMPSSLISSTCSVRAQEQPGPRAARGS